MKGLFKRSALVIVIVLVLVGGLALALALSEQPVRPGSLSYARPALAGNYPTDLPAPSTPPRTISLPPQATVMPPPTLAPDPPETYNFSQPRDPLNDEGYSKDALKQVLSNEQIFPTPGQYPLNGLDNRYNPIAPATISFEVFQRVLLQGKSPALPEARAMYDICLREHCDPAVALAFFDHESSLGTQGVAVQTKSLGNIRCTHDPCVRTEGNGAFQAYYTWTEGIQAWAILLRDTYLAKWRLATVDQIIPRYAPGDQSIEYIKVVRRKVDNLRLFGKLR